MQNLELVNLKCYLQPVHEFLIENILIWWSSCRSTLFIAVVCTLWIKWKACLPSNQFFQKCFVMYLLDSLLHIHGIFEKCNKSMYFWWQLCKGSLILTLCCIALLISQLFFATSHCGITTFQEYEWNFYVTLQCSNIVISVQADAVWQYSAIAE